MDTPMRPPANSCPRSVPKSAGEMRAPQDASIAHGKSWKYQVVAGELTTVLSDEIKRGRWLGLLFHPEAAGRTRACRF